MSFELNNSISLGEEMGQRSQSQSRKPSSYVPGQKCGKWSHEEHLKYVVFIDYNKEKMRSKQKRRSNKFYEEMARFISTRNALQCRSHHQKLEEKYSQVNKIINLFKPTFNRSVYRQTLDELDAITHSIKLDLSQSLKSISVMKVDASVQTDIQDIQCEFIQVEPNIIVMQTKGQHSANPQFYHSPSIYYPSPYQNFEYPTHASVSPSYLQTQLGWWSTISTNGF